MKSPSLELLVSVWSTAPADRRAAALSVLRDGPRSDTSGPRVLRWKDAAKELSISTRALRYAVDAADIEPIRLPGRDRAIGIRATDLASLAGEGGC